MVIGDALQEEFLAIEFESELGRELHGADAEVVLHAVYHLAVLHQCHFGTIEVRRLARPQLRSIDGSERELYLRVQQFVLQRSLGLALGHQLSVGSVYLGEDVHIERFATDAFELHLHLNIGSSIGNLRCGDVETMAGNGNGILHHQVDIPEDATASIPTRTSLRTCVGTHCHDVFLIIIEQFGDVHLIAVVAIFVAADLFAVDPHVAHVHDALEVEQHPMVFPCLIGLEGFAVPACFHGLETTSTACRLIPRLFHLEVVR